MENRDAFTVMGVFFSNLGLVLNPTEVNMWAAFITAFAGVATVAITFYNAVKKQRIMVKNEHKAEMEVRKAELELIILEQQVKNYQENATNRKNAKRV